MQPARLSDRLKKRYPSLNHPVGTFGHFGFHSFFQPILNFPDLIESGRQDVDFSRIIGNEKDSHVIIDSNFSAVFNILLSKTNPRCNNNDIIYRHPGLWRISAYGQRRGRHAPGNHNREGRRHPESADSLLYRYHLPEETQTQASGCLS